ncbi:aspB aspartate aminotransferase [Thermotomaculum hydrothermale]|uniref:Aminotransferase n=1 Tax=Thermotomaculum hydrothermale TaxID=981385 RepID=A0A7R6PYM8_9BACT|nr:pyridoxal phosphate-dependent aminotransferase [Thermotomaculum hydrothermale]BBB33260.1 aspB aspartate aminotransferase [Thermotomaculum hydrothermale]
MAPKISIRGTNQPASPMRRLEPLFLQAKEVRKRIYQLNIGQPDIETPEEYLKVIKNLQEKVIKYGPSAGLPEYRKTLANYYRSYGINVDWEDIVVTTGGSEGIIFVLTAICDPEDEVIIPEPFYANYNGFANMANVKLVPVTSKPENGYALPPIEEIEKKVNSKTKAIIICNPGNPTGYAYSEEEIENLKDLCRKHSLFLVSDEVYREFVYEGKHNSILEKEGFEEYGIITDSLSKRFSLCGARLGCVVSKNKDIISSITKMAQARLCPPTIEQLAAIEVHKLGKDYYSKIREEYKLRRDTVMKHIEEIDGAFCKIPNGAFYMLVKLPIKDCINFATYMLKDFELDNETVLVAPGNGFYATQGLGMDEIRIAYILNKNDLDRAMVILKEGLKAYRKERGL